MPEFKQNNVSKAIWCWREDGGGRNKGVAAYHRKRVIIQFLLMIVAAAVLRFVFKLMGIPVVIFCVGIFVLVSGFLAPSLFIGFNRFMKGIGRLTGTGMTWLLLCPFFYIVFAPVRLVLLLRGIDPMKRRFPSDESTYWVKQKKPPRGPEDYRKQY